MVPDRCLVILTPGFAASETDENCLPMQQALVRSLNHVDPSLHIIIIAFQYPYAQTVYEWHGNVVFSLNGRNRGGLARLMLRKKVQNILKQLHRRSPISGLLSFWLGECAYMGKSFGSRYGIPHYCWISGQDAKAVNPYPKRMKVVENELVAMSDFLRDEFERNHGVRPFQVIQPGVKNFQIQERQRDIDILGAGSFIPLKRFDLWIEIVTKMQKSIPNLKAVLAGEGPERKKLEAMISEAGLHEQIELTGEIPHSEMLEMMQRTKLLVHTSGYEGFSGVCQEALYAGAHVVSFCRAMNRDYQQWHIVSDMEEMSRRVHELLSATDLKFEREEIFSVDQTAKEILKLYV